MSAAAVLIGALWIQGKSALMFTFDGEVNIRNNVNASYCRIRSKIFCIGKLYCSCKMSPTELIGVALITQITHVRSMRKTIIYNKVT